MNHDLFKCLNWIFFLFVRQTEIAKRLSALINQLLPCLQPEHQQSVLQAVERAKQVTMPELNAIIGVSIFRLIFLGGFLLYRQEFLLEKNYL